MPITDRDRKLLWGRAGNTCAICKSQLTADAKGGDRDVVLGEEAHIVSEEPNGPRYRPMPKKEVDSYANLLLLCPSHHKIVDEQIIHYTEQRLQALKSDHEQWVKDHTSAQEPAIRIRDPEADKPLIVRRVGTGKEVMSIVAHACATAHDHPEPQSAEEARLIGGFLQNVTDCIDVWDDIGASGRIEAEFDMSKEITQLRETGLVVYAGVKKKVMEGGGTPPRPWPIAYILIRRGDPDETQMLVVF